MSLISTENRSDALAYAKALTGSANSGGAVAGGFQSLLSSANDRANAILGTLNATVAEPSTAVNAQVIGQTETTEIAEPSAKDEFLEFMAMDPAARMRAQMLGGMGLTEEELAAMPADERRKIEDRIQEMIEAKIQEDTEENVAEAASTAIQAESAPVAASAGAGAAKVADAKPGDATSKEGITSLDAMFPFLRPDTVTQTNAADDRAA